tara:strand:+ start:264 stop:491 length:228 start_codon:yes stop_codon:yes gene_type:complete
MTAQWPCITSTEPDLRQRDNHRAWLANAHFECLPVQLNAHHRTSIRLETQLAMLPSAGAIISACIPLPATAFSRC